MSLFDDPDAPGPRPQAGGAARDDLEHFAELEGSRWSVVEELEIP
ncbi:MAG: hypothetical protein V3S87_03110 [Alphaproteobacteria bacterium]